MSKGSYRARGGIRRILVGLDASPSSEEALRSAVALATEVGAEVEGLFVEDSELMSFAELPFATLTGAITSRQVQMGQLELARTMRAQADRARRALAQAAEGARVPWSFRVVRGQVERELLEAADGADLLILGRAGISARRRARGGSLARRAARSARLVLIEHEGRRPVDGPVVVLAQPGERALRLLEVAAPIALAQRRTLTVLIPAGADERRFVRRAQALLRRSAKSARAEEGQPLRVRWLSTSFTGPHAALAEALRTTRGGVLVLDADNLLLDERRVEELVDRSGCTLLLLR
jgi:nucleotide-binding universal stress UspA family protein